MRRWIYRVGAILTLLAVAFWWLMLEGRSPASAPEEYDLASYRAMIADDDENLPIELRIETVGTDVAPGFAAETGNFGSDFHLAYTALQISWPDQNIVIGGAADEATAEEMEQSSQQAQFDQSAYDRITRAMTTASQVLITHEHLDHVMAIARHPDPAALAPNLRLSQGQLDAMPQFAIDGELAPEIAGVTPIDASAARRIAPGVVLVPSAGHSPNSQSFYIRLANGTEYLLIGDIVWQMTNIDTLRTRPRLLQYLMFDPNEDRPRVLAQVRALHDMREANPELVIVPSHDRIYLEGLVETGNLVQGFAP